MKYNIIILMLLCTSITLCEQQHVSKTVLDNGLTVLVCPTDNTQKVAVQIWYNVGSKDENNDERGLAHLLEHMVFKGTQKLSEVDIPLVSHHFSGEFNAGTNYDYTVYYFNFPIQYWDQALPIFADCMRNCTFKEDLLNAEFKTVIQELKMYKDYFLRSLAAQLYTTIFPDHPYHFPIIGYKQNLWDIHQSDLLKFYKKHYVPNNATIVVVGAVSPDEVIEKVKLHFGSIAPDRTYRKKKNYYNKDLSTYAVTVYRDVQKSEYVLAYPIPGSNNKTDFCISALSSAITNGKSSRLTKKFVHDLKLVSSISSYSYQTFEHDLFFIHFQPFQDKDVDIIISLIQQELDDIAMNGIKEGELKAASRHMMRDIYSLMENNHQLAYSIGKYYLATGDENYIVNYASQDLAEIGKQIKELASTYLQESQRSLGIIVPANAQQRALWKDIQQKSDDEDIKFLSGRVRESEVEAPLFSQNLCANDIHHHSLPTPTETICDNGLKVITYTRSGIAKVSLVLKLKADSSYDPDECQGLYNIMCSMLFEGTKKYTAYQLANELESRGIVLSISPGFVHMEMLSSEFEKGLELLYEILLNPSFTQEGLDKVKNLARTRYKEFCESPREVSNKMIYEHIYKNHPYSKSYIANDAVIDAITCSELQKFHKKVINPNGALLAVVGDFDEKRFLTAISKIAQQPFEKVKDLSYPTLNKVEKTTIMHSMNRDQVVLGFAGLSVNRFHPDYDKLAIFDEIFANGMHSRLFSLRLKYGLFYTIRGSLIEGADEQPGIVVIKTIVSPDKVSLAEQLINQEIDTIIDSITDKEIEEAKQVILNQPINAYANNYSIASTFLFLNKYKLPYSYFNDRIKSIETITLEEVKQAARAILSADKLITVKVGRV